MFIVKLAAQTTRAFESISLTRIEPLSLGVDAVHTRNICLYIISMYVGT